MTIIANLDAEIEQFYAEQGAVTRELQIFGRVWPLIPAMTSVTLAPLMNLQAAAQMANGGVVPDDEARMALFQFLGSVNQILANVIREDERPEFLRIISERGFPLGILDKVIEAIMQAFDAAPFDSGTQTASAPPMPVPPLASSTTSGNSSEAVGGTSMPTSTPTPSVPTSAAPVAPRLAVAEWDSEPKLQAYDEATALIPPSVKDIVVDGAQAQA